MDILIDFEKEYWSITITRYKNCVEIWWLEIGWHKKLGLIWKKNGV